MKPSHSWPVGKVDQRTGAKAQLIYEGYGTTEVVPYKDLEVATQTLTPLIFRALNGTVEQAAEKIFWVNPSEARDLLLLSASKKQQIPRANPALRNDMAGVFPQPVKT